MTLTCIKLCSDWLVILFQIVLAGLCSVCYGKRPDLHGVVSMISNIWSTYNLTFSVVYLYNKPQDSPFLKFLFFQDTLHSSTLDILFMLKAVCKMCSSIKLLYVFYVLYFCIDSDRKQFQ